MKGTLGRLANIPSTNWSPDLIKCEWWADLIFFLNDFDHDFNQTDSSQSILKPEG